MTGVQATGEVLDAAGAVAATAAGGRRRAPEAAFVAGIACLVWVQARLYGGLGDIVSGDGRVLYLPTQRNIVRHGAYSVMDAAPHLPTITKMPGYSVFLAALHAVFGGGLGPVRVAQFTMLGVTALVCAELGRRHFDATVGVAAAVAVVLCPSLAFYAQIPLSETLTCLLTVVHLGVLLELSRHDVRPAPRRELLLAVAVGASLGLLVLVRQTFVLLLPVIVGAALLDARSRRGWRDAIRRCATICAVCTLLVGPWCVRNIVVSGKLLPFGANSGLSLIASARQYAGQHDDELQPPYLETVAQELVAIDRRLGMPTGTAPGLAEGVGGGPQREAMLDARLTELARAEIAEVPTTRILRSIPERLVLLWGPNTTFTPFSVFEVALVVAGMTGAVVHGRRRGLWPLWVLVTYLSAFHLVFHVEQRYSVPARPPLFVLGAACAVGIHRRLRRWRSTTAAR